jgi:hypothetical protein
LACDARSAGGEAEAARRIACSPRDFKRGRYLTQAELKQASDKQETAATEKITIASLPLNAIPDRC